MEASIETMAAAAALPPELLRDELPADRSPTKVEAGRVALLAAAHVMTLPEDPLRPDLLPTARQTDAQKVVNRVRWAVGNRQFRALSAMALRETEILPHHEAVEYMISQSGGRIRQARIAHKALRDHSPLPASPMIDYFLDREVERDHILYMDWLAPRQNPDKLRPKEYPKFGLSLAVESAPKVIAGAAKAVVKASKAAARGIYKLLK